MKFPLLGGLFAALVLPPALSAVTLEELFTAARERDYKGAVLEEERRGRLLDERREDHKQGWQLKASSGDLRFTSEQEGKERTFSAAPGAGVVLPYPAATELMLEAPLTFPLGDPEERSAAGRLKVEQPLNGLLGWEEGEALKKQERSREAFRWGWNRFKGELEIRRAVTDLLLQVIEKQEALLKLRGERLDKAVEKETALRFGTVGEGTSAALRYDLEIHKLEREELEREQEKGDALARLERLTGFALEGVPELPGFLLPVLPPPEERNRAAGLRLEEWELAVRRERLQESLRSPPPRVSLSGSLLAGEESREGEAVLTAKGEEFSFRAGARLDREEWSLSGSLAWTGPDRTRQRLEEALEASRVRAQTLTLEGAYPDHLEQERNFSRSIANLRLRRETLAEDINLTELVYEEQDYAFRKGFITQRELEQNTIGLEILRLDRLALTLEALNLQMTIDAYYYDGREG